MNKKAEFLTIAIAALSLLVAIGQWLLPLTGETGSNILEAKTDTSTSSLNLPSVLLKVSGMNTTINIKPGNSPYKGGNIRSMDSLSTIYLPAGQYLKVKVTGMNVTLNIHKSLASFVSVSTSGLGTKVNEL